MTDCSMEYEFSTRKLYTVQAMVVIYHHSAGCVLTSICSECQNRKNLMYLSTQLSCATEQKSYIYLTS